MTDIRKENQHGGFTLKTLVQGNVALVWLKAWGFWDEPFAKEWHEAILAACDEARAMPAKKWCVVADNSEFPAQLEGVKALIGQAMQRATQLGMAKSAVILNNTLTKLQLRSIGQKSGVPGLTFHLSEQDALAEMLRD